jgi:thioredoxin-like negative regulator of GroEL
MPSHALNPVDGVTAQTFAERVVHTKRPVLVQFWATSTSPSGGDGL